MAENESPNSRSRLFAWLVASGIGFPLIYLLSVGPVLCVMDKTNGFGGVLTWQMIRKIYWPIEWLYENTFLEKPIDLYLQLWGLK